MKKISVAVVALLALSACGTSTVDDTVRQIQTPEGLVTCVVVASQGGSAVAVDCNWETLP